MMILNKKCLTEGNGANFYALLLYMPFELMILVTQVR